MKQIIHEYVQPEASRNGKSSAKLLQQNAQDAFPYLEKFRMVTEKNPYAMLAAMIGVAAIVVTAVTTFSIAIFTGAFLLYGQMGEMRSDQKQILAAINENREEVKVLRTYEASVLARQNYIAGMMDNKHKEQLNQYDKANPLPRLPDKLNKEKP